MSRGLKAVALFFAFVVIFTASRHLAGHTTPTSTTSSTSTTATSTTTSTTSTTTTLTSACVASDFTGTFAEGQGAAGTVTSSVTLINQGETCRVDGYPLLTLQGATGSVLEAKQVNQQVVQFPTAAANAPAAPVVVAHGQATDFSLAFTDVPVGSETCASAVTLSVQFSAGGSSVPITLAYPIAPCNHGTIWVSPLYAHT